MQLRPNHPRWRYHLQAGEPAAPSERFNFADMEEDILKLWEGMDAFQTSLKFSEGRKEFNFYDGPPFATGTPHYGHLLAGTIKVRRADPGVIPSGTQAHVAVNV